MCEVEVACDVEYIRDCATGVKARNKNKDLWAHLGSLNPTSSTRTAGHACAETPRSVRLRRARSAIPPVSRAPVVGSGAAAGGRTSGCPESSVSARKKVCRAVKAKTPRSTPAGRIFWSVSEPMIRRSIRCRAFRVPARCQPADPGKPPVCPATPIDRLLTSLPLSKNFARSLLYR